MPNRAEPIWPASLFLPDHFGGAHHGGATLANQFILARPFQRCPSLQSHSGQAIIFRPDHFGGAQHGGAVLASQSIFARPFWRCPSLQSHSGQPVFFGRTTLAVPNRAEPFWLASLYRPDHFSSAHHGLPFWPSHNISARPLWRCTTWRSAIWPASLFLPDHFGGAHSGQPVYFGPTISAEPIHGGAILASQFILARPFRRCPSRQAILAKP